MTVALALPRFTVPILSGRTVEVIGEPQIMFLISFVMLSFLTLFVKLKVNFFHIQGPDKKKVPN